MKFFRYLFILLTIGLFLGFPSLWAEEQKPSGKDLFLKYKCNKCHTITGLNIGKGEVEKGEDEEEEEITEEEKIEPPDLSGVGKKHQADWLTQYLLKKEKIEDRKHKKRFKGSKEELEIISKWLGSLKHEVKTQEKK